MTFASLMEMGYCGCYSLLPAFAKESACSFPQIPQWAGIHCIVTCTMHTSPVDICVVFLVRLSAGDGRLSVYDWQSVRKTKESVCSFPQILVWAGIQCTEICMVRATLQASLSGKLQTLPHLVVPLKGHSLSPCSCPPALAKGLGTNNYDCGSSLAPKHPRKHETRPPRVKKKKKSSVSIQTIVVLFVLM